MSRPLDPISAKHTHKFANATFTVDARYTPTRVIGTGAYGVVCAARDNLAKKDVAIKKIKHSFQIATIAKRTLREIKLLRHFDRHENVISIKTILQPPPHPEEFNDIYIVMGLKESDLHRIVHSEQPLTEEHARYFLYQTLRGLKYIHSANVLHRDIKPSNLLINSNCALKICDFGMARGVASTPEEHAGFMTAYVATRWYRAPEVMLSFRKYTYAIDMWSVGCIFAEMLGRKYLFPGQNYVHQLNLILNVLGTPSPELLAEIGNARVKSYLDSLDRSAKIPLAKLYPAASAESLELLESMLQFNPAERCTVEQALAHPFHKRYHKPQDEPTCTPFKFDFDEEQLSMAQLKTLILREVQGYHTPANHNDMCVPCISGATHTHVDPTGATTVMQSSAAAQLLQKPFSSPAGGPASAAGGSTTVMAGPAAARSVASMASLSPQSLAAAASLKRTPQGELARQSKRSRTQPPLQAPNGWEPPLSTSSMPGAGGIGGIQGLLAATVASSMPTASAAAAAVSPSKQRVSFATNVVAHELSPGGGGGAAMAAAAAMPGRAFAVRPGASLASPPSRTTAAAAAAVASTSPGSMPVGSRLLAPGLEIDFTQTALSPGIIGAASLPALDMREARPGKAPLHSAQAISDIAAELRGLTSAQMSGPLDRDLERMLGGALAFTKDEGHV